MTENSDNIFITGPSGSGKSTLVKEVIEGSDIEAEGLVTPDIREGGRRKGFEFRDLKTGDTGTLAHVKIKEGPRVGKYRVDLDEVERFTKKSLEDISPDCELLVIDEIGRMELFSGLFEETVKERLEDDVPVLAVLHRSYVDEYSDYGTVLSLKEREYEDIKEEVMERLHDMN